MKAKKPVYPIPFKDKCSKSKVGSILVIIGLFLNIGLMIPMTFGNLGYGAIPLLITMATTAWPLLVVGIVLLKYGLDYDIAKYEKEHGINHNESEVTKEEVKSNDIPVKAETTVSKVEVPVASNPVETEKEKALRLEAEKDKKYHKALDYYYATDYVNAISIFKTIIDYADSKSLYNECNNKLKEIDNENKYNKALDLINIGNYKEAYRLFTSLKDYKDSEDKAISCKEVLDKKAKKAKKKALATLCIIGGVVVLAIGGVVANSIIKKEKSKGDGSIEKPYTINNADQLRNANEANANYVLANDITLTDEDLNAIINVNYNLDGNGKTIYYEGNNTSVLFDTVNSNCTINNVKVHFKVLNANWNSKGNYGLLASTNNGTISNIKYELYLEGTYTGNGTVDDYAKIAPIEINNGELSNLDFSPTLKITSTTAYFEASGVCVTNNGTINDSKSYATVKVPGAAGYAIENNGIINNCNSNGLVTGEHNFSGIDVLAAGFAMFNNEKGKITNCTSDAVCTIYCGTTEHGYTSGGVFMNYGLIDNTNSTSEICLSGASGEKVDIYNAVSGICSFNYNIISNCTFTGNLKSLKTGASAICLAGICAQNDTDGKLTNCHYNPQYNEPIRISGTTGTVYIAGVVVYSAGTLSGCSCSITSAPKVSGANIQFENIKFNW